MRNEKNREGDKKDSSSQLMIVALLTANVNQLINAYEYDNLEGKKKTLRTVVMGLLSVSLSLQVNFDYHLTLIIKVPKFQTMSLFQSTLKTNAQKFCPVACMLIRLGLFMLELSKCQPLNKVVAL